MTTLHFHLLKGPEIINVRDEGGNEVYFSSLIPYFYPNF